MNRLEEKYLKEVKEKLKVELKLKNDLSIPKLSKVVISMGLGEAKDNKEVLDRASLNLAALSGQKPVATYAQKSISAFKVSEGQPIGLMVTLRGTRMYQFLDKLINAVLPKVRDFRGVAEASFDKSGNFNIGLKEQLVFPEVDYSNVDKVRGLCISIITTSKNVEEGKRLLKLLGFPFQRG